MSEVDLSTLDFVEKNRWVKGILRLLCEKGPLEFEDIHKKSFINPHLDEQTDPEKDSMFGNPLETAMQSLLMEEILVLNNNNRYVITNLGHSAIGHFELIQEI